MRTLLVLRHSKASDPLGVDDLERPLSDRGRRDASAVGAWLAGKDLRPGHVLCSPSRRTRQTLEGLGLDDTIGVDFDPRIYSAGSETLLQVIAEVADDVRTLLLVGHNPAAHRLVFDLTGGASEGFPTSALAVIRIPQTEVTDWADLRPGAGRLETLHVARG